MKSLWSVCGVLRKYVCRVVWCRAWHVARTVNSGRCCHPQLHVGQGTCNAGETNVEGTVLRVCSVLRQKNAYGF